MTSLLEVKGIAKSFHGLRALNQVSFDAEPGAIVALIGPNGAGKTTLFNVIAGMLAPDVGEIYFAGQRIDGWRADQVCAAGIGRTFQIVRPFAALSVLDNVMVGTLLRTKGVSAARRHAEDILEPLGLGPKKHLPAAALTLPDRKLLEVARALATQPKLLLLDEVLAGLRPGECDQVIQVLLGIHQRDGMTILMIEHVMRAVMALAQQIVVLHHGEVIAAGCAGHDCPRPTRARMLSRRGNSAVTALLEVRDLDLYYGDAQALDRVSLKVDQGSIVAIVGANGAGKSSLIRAIAGIEAARAGEIYFAGHAIRGLDTHRICDLGIGQVAEGRQLFPTLTTLENLEMGAAGAARPRPDERKIGRSLRALSPIARAQEATRRHVVGRRAANARHRPLSDGLPGTDHARRAVARARARYRAGHAARHS